MEVDELIKGTSTTYTYPDETGRATLLIEFDVNKKKFADILNDLIELKDDLTTKGVFPKESPEGNTHEKFVEVEGF